MRAYSRFSLIRKIKVKITGGAALSEHPPPKKRIYKTAMWLPVINSFSSLTAGINSAEVPSGKASDETASRDSVDYGYLYAVLRGVFWPI